MISGRSAAGEGFARCGAAARRAALPPATLRVWERRYGVVGPERSPSGQRLYSEQDVQRLIVLKRVVDRGYAIGTVARLSTEQLERLAMATDSNPRQSAVPLLKWAIVGQALQERLAPLAAVMRNHRGYEDLAAAMAALEPGSADIILLQVPSLRAETARLILELAARHPLSAVTVVYSFGVALAVTQLRDAGILLLRDPLSRIQLLQALDDLARSIAQSPSHPPSTKLERMPRILSDRALALIERRSTSIACECPTHLTALINQLAAFEHYSDGCVSHDARGGALHRHIGDVTSHARSLLESLLQRVAADEGLTLDLATVESLVAAV